MITRCAPEREYTTLDHATMPAGAVPAEPVPPHPGALTGLLAAGLTDAAQRHETTTQQAKHSRRYSTPV